MSKRLTFKYRIYPTKKQVDLLDGTLSLCSELYNAALQERRDAWRINRKSIGYFDQSKQLVELKQLRPEVRNIHSQVLQDTLRRVDKTFKAFFVRVKRKSKAGFPRFRSHWRYDSFTYPQDGFSVQSAHLVLSKIGKVKIKLHRPIEGKIKTLTIKREAGRWYACFSVEVQPQPLPACQEAVGIDVGLTTFATLSDGTEISSPNWYRDGQKAVRLAQRKLARRKKGSKRRREAVRILQQVHAHIRNQRADFHHKISRWLVDNYGTIVVEKLNVKGMVKNHCLAKSISDAGWGMFLDKIAYKAENAGRQFFRVNPNGTSQTCTCGAHVPKDLSQRLHECSTCGLSAPRDRVSAQVILLRAGIPLSSANASH